MITGSRGTIRERLRGREIKNEYVTKSLNRVAFAWKEAPLYAYFVSAGRLGENELLVLFIPASAVSRSEMKPLMSFLGENGIVVITDSESHGVLKVLDSSYKARYGLSLIDGIANWYGVPRDPEVRAPQAGGGQRRDLQLHPRLARLDLDLAVEAFAEDPSLAVRLRDFVKRNWDLIAQVSGVAAKLAFDEWCRRNPPKSPEREQLRQLVGKALDAYNVGVAALGGLRVLVSRCRFSCWSVRGLPG